MRSSSVTLCCPFLLMVLLLGTFDVAEAMPPIEVPDECITNEDCSDLDLGVCVEGRCDEDGCQAVPLATACGPEGICQGECQLATGQCLFDDELPCDADGDECTPNDECEEGLCVAAGFAEEGTPCDEGDRQECVKGFCLNGVCQSEANDFLCGSSSCRGNCIFEDGTCEFSESDGDPCEVSGECLVGTCEQGACGSQPSDALCSDLDEGDCIEGLCDSGSGNCVATPVGSCAAGGVAPSNLTAVACVCPKIEDKKPKGKEKEKDGLGALFGNLDKLVKGDKAGGGGLFDGLKDLEGLKDLGDMGDLKEMFKKFRGDGGDEGLPDLMKGLEGLFGKN
uniref:Uncharacterized protein n=1 Tax=Chromera velia CCMP2878 TaxID=1169474 RepID=A0A0G4G315_9ALVE|eukprot:Cvel_20020.t1-p1 / transcript=Cvel_20020.t1 / gene=Cvel_20020 / organism=Chromera_velia_CCMP2878 / gene_product=Tenascin, putative / transcript_product=Tenascin, putative / location=Cvel_scaffold1767:6866-11207(-) / protein_length=336 / sequence_SO=supercontig / SO=protein_coding / is_pseudo=false